MGLPRSVFIILVTIGTILADSPPSNAYGAPQQNGFNGGQSGALANQYQAPRQNSLNGGSNGAPANQYKAPRKNGFNGESTGAAANQYQAPRQNGQNGGSNRAPANQYQAPRQNGFTGGSNGASSNRYEAPPQNGGYSAEDEALEALSSLPGGGVPGEDFPILSSMPDTGFSCGEQNFPGYYADVAEEAGCQVFHICQQNPDGSGVRQDYFLCPNGSIFNQQYFVCDWWFNVDCAQSEQFFELNQLIEQEPESQGYDNGAGSNGGTGGPYENGAHSNGANGDGNGSSYSNGRNGSSNGRNGKKSNGGGKSNGGSSTGGYSSPTSSIFNGAQGSEGGYSF